jgi:hypothetical protein
MKVLRFGKGGHGKVVALKEYTSEEAATIKYTHISTNLKGERFVWLQSYGLTDWAVVFPTEAAMNKFLQGKEKIERYIGGGQ